MIYAKTIVCLALLCYLAGPHAQGQAGVKSVLDGVYTAEQAERGKTLYDEACVDCHGEEDFIGTLLESWKGASVGALLELISDMMPQDRPRALSRQQYADIVAYIFQLNGLLPGREELPAGKEALQRIIIESGS